MLNAAVHHALTVHEHGDSPELRAMLRTALIDEPAPSRPGGFVQLIEFSTDRVEEWTAIQDRWAAAIGDERGNRWSLVGADRDRPDTYVAIVEFPSHEAATGDAARDRPIDIPDGVSRTRYSWIRVRHAWRWCSPDPVDLVDFELGDRRLSGIWAA